MRITKKPKAMFIEVRNTKGDLILLNVNHIISIEPKTHRSYKVGEKDKQVTYINSVGAMVLTTVVYESVEEIGELIKSCSK